MDRPGQREVTPTKIHKAITYNKNNLHWNIEELPLNAFAPLTCPWSGCGFWRLIASGHTALAAARPPCPPSSRPTRTSRFASADAKNKNKTTIIKKREILQITIVNNQGRWPLSDKHCLIFHTRANISKKTKQNNWKSSPGLGPLRRWSRGVRGPRSRCGSLPSFIAHSNSWLISSRWIHNAISLIIRNVWALKKAKNKYKNK